MASLSELDMLVSGIINKNGEKKACVYFQSKSDTSIFAEGYIPDCQITSYKGFSEAEIEKLEEYMRENVAELKKTAGGVNPIRAMMKE